MPTAFELALQAGRLVFDGPLGTEVLARGYRPPFEELNATAPALVRDLHRAYVAAGARLLRANTFLARDGRVGRAAELNRLGLEIARDAARGGVWVGASVGGPLAGPVASWARRGAAGATSSEPGFREAVRAQAAALAGADFIALETFLRPEDLEVALDAVREGYGGPVLAFVTLRSDLPTRLDTTTTQRLYDQLDRFLEVVSRREVAAVGMNCVPPGGRLELARDFLARRAGRPWGLLPSTALGASQRAPVVTPERRPEPDDRGVVAACQAALAAGASFVGVCCGGTPETVRRLARLVRPPRIRFVKPLPARAGRRAGTRPGQRAHPRTGGARPRPPQRAQAVKPTRGAGVEGTRRRSGAGKPGLGTGRGGPRRGGPGRGGPGRPGRDGRGRGRG